MIKLYTFLRFKILPIRKIEKLLPKKGLVLDVGCGYGVTSIYFALKNKNRQIVGSELDSKRVKIAKKNSRDIKNLTFKKANLIDNEKVKFDCIVAIDLLHHISDLEKQKFISKAKEILKNDGTLIIKDIDKKPFLKYFWNYFHDLLMTKFSRLYFFSSKDFENLLIKNNFKIIKKGKFKSFFYPHIFYVCQKNS